MKKTVLCFCISVCTCCNAQTNMNYLYGMNTSVVLPAAPFLLFAPDSRSAAMGETGTATSPDAFSPGWNFAKSVFADKQEELGIAYQPVLRAIIPDVNFADISFFHKLNDDEALGGSVRYFSAGNISVSTAFNPTGQFRPNAYAVDAGYSRKFSEYFSAGITGRVIRSDILLRKPATAFATDISAFYTKPGWISGKAAVYSSGINISNIGTKMPDDTSGTLKNLPCCLHLGQSIGVQADTYNRISFSLDLNNILAEKSSGGFYGQLHQTIIGTGLEYSYFDLFMVRAGYIHAPETAGGRQLFTFGAGIHYNVFQLDFSYAIPANRENIFGKTLCFDLAFSFDKLQNDADTQDK